MRNPLFYVFCFCIGFTIFVIGILVNSILGIRSASSQQILSSSIVIFMSALFIYYYYSKHKYAWYIAILISPLLYVANVDNWHEPFVSWQGYLILFLIEIYVLALYQPYMQYIESYHDPLNPTCPNGITKTTYNKFDFVRVFFFLGVFYVYALLRILITTDNVWEIILYKKLDVIIGIIMSVSVIICYYSKPSYTWWPALLSVPLINLFYYIQNSDMAWGSMFTMHVIISTTIFAYIVVKYLQRNRGQLSDF